MEPESSLPCSQEPAAGPYHEPDEFSSHSNILILWDNFNIIFTSSSWSAKRPPSLRFSKYFRLITLTVLREEYTNWRQSCLCI
jgi:hypothetical protein